MLTALFANLTLVDASGRLIIAAILLTLAAYLLASLVVRARYAVIAADLRRRGEGLAPTFSQPVLNFIVEEVARSVQARGEANVQAVVEHAFASKLRLLLLGERFARNSTGLVIIFGLVGTFYGLTLSIGKLAVLVAADTAAGTDVGRALTAGLTQALAGMAVAFTGSLFGISSAIVMNVLGVFISLSDQRQALMVEIEAFVESVLPRPGDDSLDAAVAGHGGPARVQQLERIVHELATTVARLEGVVGQFDASTTAFSTTTRDFREFNLHLKDNIQRMSLGFADLSETLRAHAASFQGTHPLGDPRRRG